MRTLKELYFASPLYHWRLAMKPVDRFATRLSDTWPGDPAAGRALVDGQIIYQGLRVQLSGDPWAEEPDLPGLLEHLHGFSWLRDLRELGGEPARLKARDLVGRWLDRHDEWDALIWRPDIAGQRVAAWLSHYDFFCESADDDFRAAYFDSLCRQYRHLAGDIDASADGARRIVAAKGLVLGTVALDSARGRLPAAISWLDRELARQIAGDGGHRSRSPSVHLSVLADLIDVRTALRLAEREHAGLDEIVARMTGMLRLWRHGDGGLALFNRSNEGDIWFIDSVLAKADIKGRRIAEAPETGFQRILAGRSCVIMDTGMPSHRDRAAHAGLLAFEFSVGKQRVIVNCGASPAEERWDGPLRATAAHSTLVVDDRNAAEIAADGTVGPRPSKVTSSRTEDHGNCLIEAEHDGYVPTHGLRHVRRLYLSQSGDDLRVEDRLIYTGDPGDLPREACIRLHLHPKVSASIVQSGTAALLRLATGSGWRLRCDSGLAINESVYFGESGRFQRTQQLVIRVPLDDIRRVGETAVRWALRREEAKVQPTVSAPAEEENDEV